MAKHYTTMIGYGTSHEIPIMNNILTTFQSQDDDSSATIRLERLLVEKLNEFKERTGLSLENGLLILDHTTSNTAINFPIESVATVARKEGMLVAVDGAHGLLAQELDLRLLSRAGVDFYISNCHKWFCSPRGAAFLYCEDPTLRESILNQPAVISHGIDDGYHSRFIWDGCRDYAAQLSIPVLIQFWEQMGLSRVRKIIRSNLLSAICLIVHKWYPEIESSPDLMSIASTATGAMIVPVSLHSPMVRFCALYFIFMAYHLAFYYLFAPRL